MITDHATVQREGFTVPLIGIPPSAMLEECDCCHDQFSIRDMQLCDGQMLCPKCRKDSPCKSETLMQG